jgi:hypothetical protein
MYQLGRICLGIMRGKWPHTADSRSFAMDPSSWALEHQKTKKQQKTPRTRAQTGLKATSNILVDSIKSASLLSRLLFAISEHRFRNITE